MKHIVVLSEIYEPNGEPKVYKRVVIEKPPLILTYREMYFMLTHSSIPNPNVTQYNYMEVEGVPLGAISTSEIVE